MTVLTPTKGARLYIGDAHGRNYVDAGTLTGFEVKTLIVDDPFGFCVSSEGVQINKYDGITGHRMLAAPAMGKTRALNTVIDEYTERRPNIDLQGLHNRMMAAATPKKERREGKQHKLKGLRS